MDYEDLRRIQRIERNNSKIALLDDSFYDDLGMLLAKFKDSSSEEDRRMFANIMKVAKDVLERREQKVLSKTLRCVRSKEIDTENLISHEKRMFEELTKALRNNREEFKKIIFGEGYTKPEPEKPSIHNIPKTVDDTVAVTEVAEPKLTELDKKKDNKFELKPEPETGIIELPSNLGRPRYPDLTKQTVSEKLEEDLNNVVVRIIKKVPKFVSSDMNEFGPFEENDVVKLPKDEAELLSRRSFVELI